MKPKNTKKWKSSSVSLRVLRGNAISYCKSKNVLAPVGDLFLVKAIRIKFICTSATDGYVHTNFGGRIGWHGKAINLTEKKNPKLTTMAKDAILETFPKLKFSKKLESNR